MINSCSIETRESATALGPLQVLLNYWHLIRPVGRLCMLGTSCGLSMGIQAGWKLSLLSEGRSSFNGFTVSQAES